MGTDEATQRERQARPELVVGLLAAPGLSSDVAQHLAAQLPDVMRQRAPDVDWRFEVRSEPLVGAAGIDVDLVQLSRERLLEEGWQLAICLTDLPLRVGRRPVTAYVSASLGVGVLSVPALGALDIEARVLTAVLRVLEQLLSRQDGRHDRAPADRGGRTRIRLRLRHIQELASPMGRPHVADREVVQYVTAAAPGTLRLVLGMVRANRPWRLIIGLSRALVAALGTAAFGLTSPPIWRIADAMGWPRLLALAVGALLSIGLTLIFSHRLWEHSRSRATRDRVALINLSTTLTVALGVLTMFAAMLCITTICDTAVLLPPVLEHELAHEVGFGQYVRIAWLVSSMATLGGALGAALESDITVREATYGYRPADDAPAQGEQAA
jgi:hypothetical protein